MKDKLIEDVMVPVEEYPCIPDTHTLRDAIEEMALQIVRVRQRTLPRVVLVFDEDFTELLGMLRRRDIMRGLEPRFLMSGSLEYQRKWFNVAIDPNLSELSHDKIAAHIRRRSERLVRDYMIPIRATVRHDDHIMKAVCEMVDQNTSVIPVLKEGKVVGVVRSVEVLNEIVHIMNA